MPYFPSRLLQAPRRAIFGSWTLHGVAVLLAARTRSSWWQPAKVVPYIAMCKPKHDLQPPAKLYLLPNIVFPCLAS